MMTDNTKYDLIIVGGGAAGLTLAALLGAQQMRIALIEPYPPAALADTATTGRTVALMHSALNVLKAVGLDDFCTAYGTPMHMMRIIDDSIHGRPPIESEFDAFELGLDYFGLNIPNTLLRAKLFDHAQQIPSIDIIHDALADYQIKGHNVTATLNNGDTLTAPLIIGVDGKSSLTRKIAGIPTQKKDYAQAAITFVMNHARAHNNTSTEFHRAGGPFAIVPMNGNQSSIVWVEKTPDADALMTLSDTAFEAELQRRTNDILGAVTVETAPQAWPLHALLATSLIAPRVAIAAEAAHAMSPITAQGLNLSLRDIATLAETITDARRLGQDYGSQITLKTYDNRRRFDIQTRYRGVNGLNTLVSQDAAAIKTMRRTGLGLTNTIKPLKIFLMKHGLAPTLDQGRLAQGGTL